MDREDARLLLKHSDIADDSPRAVRRGRPKAEVTKVALKLRLDRSTVDAFKATGAGWQTRMNDAPGRAASRLAPKQST